MKKKTKIIISVTVMVILLISVITVGLKNFNDMPSSYLGVRAYPGNRLKINMHITVDGENAKITQNDNENYILEASGNIVTLKAKADSYDTYEYSLLVNEHIPLCITARHWNWWEITRSELYIDIDSVNECYTVYEEYKYTTENPVYMIESVTEEKEKFNDLSMINVYVGPKG